jgi:hypothetical protein
MAFVLQRNICRKEGDTMTILEVVAVITLAFTVLMYGYWIGINAKK